MLGGARGAHGVRLAGARLAVGEERDIVTLGEGADALLEVVPHAGLIDVGPEHPVEDEQLAALGRLDRQAGRRLHVDHGPLEALRDQVVAGIGGC